MQAVKEKLSDMATMRQIKHETKAEEKAEKDVAKTRVEVAKEIRKAKEAEAAMDLHVAKVGEKIQKYVDKHPGSLSHVDIENDIIGHSDNAATTDPTNVNTGPISEYK